MDCPLGPMNFVVAYFKILLFSLKLKCEQVFCYFWKSPEIDRQTGVISMPDLVVRENSTFITWHLVFFL